MRLLIKLHTVLFGKLWLLILMLNLPSISCIINFFHAPRVYKELATSLGSACGQCLAKQQNFNICGQNHACLQHVGRHSIKQ